MPNRICHIATVYKAAHTAVCHSFSIQQTAICPLTARLHGWSSRFKNLVNVRHVSASLPDVHNVFFECLGTDHAESGFRPAKRCPRFDVSSRGITSYTLMWCFAAKRVSWSSISSPLKSPPQPPMLRAASGQPETPALSADDDDDNISSMSSISASRGSPPLTSLCRTVWATACLFDPCRVRPWLYKVQLHTTSVGWGLLLLRCGVQGYKEVGGLWCQILSRSGSVWLG